MTHGGTVIRLKNGMYVILGGRTKRMEQFPTKSEALRFLDMLNANTKDE